MSDLEDLTALRDTAEFVSRASQELIDKIGNIQSQLDSLHAAIPSLRQLHAQAAAAYRQLDERVKDAKYTRRPDYGNWVTRADADRGGHDHE